MTLTLQIENYDRLPDGGPISATVTGKGMSVGRSNSMDWTLPDPQRHISSHHFEISFRDGTYYLTDMSTNGVFLDGQRHRLEGDYALKQGDRFQVGNYFIGVTLGAAAAQPAPRAPTAAPTPPPPPAFDDADPWAVSSAPAAPIDPNPRPSQDAFADFASEFIVNPIQEPTPAPPPPPAAAPVPPAAPSPFGGSDSPFASPPAPAPQPGLQSPSPLGPASTPSHLSQPPQFGLPPVPPAAAPAEPAPRPAPAAPPAPAPTPAGPDHQAILAAFYEGAGLAVPAGAAQTDPVALARELGQTMRTAATELMALLQDRAAAKQFTRSGDRTMMSAANNNPLKFLPDPNEALKVMFVEPRPGFMTGGEGVASALRDVKLHQMAVFAAIQPALIKLLEDLAPEAIEEASGGGLLQGGRRKAWDEFVKRWDAKVANHDNGMLDVFLKHFAESYAAAVAAARR